MNRDGIAALVGRVEAALGGRTVRVVRLGVEASGYHLPLLSGVLPASWQVVELNPPTSPRSARSTANAG